MPGPSRGCARTAAGTDGLQLGPRPRPGQLGVLANWDQRTAEAAYGTGASERTPWRPWSLPSLRRAFNATERHDPRFASWWADNSEEAYNTGLANAAAAFDGYSAAKRGDRKGPKVGFRDPSPSTGRPPSQRWVRAGRARNRVHHRVAHLRTDALHHLTSSLAGEYGTLAVEDLYVAGMVKNRRLARRIADAGFGQIRRQLAYKTVWNGGRLVVADRWFASSRTCSGCGATKATLPLHVRVFDCDECPLVLNEAARKELEGMMAVDTYQ